ncbi:MAG: dTMP kinase [Opitutae bacterium]|nr:dTMP kinase [Opitutae bacterium]
MPNLTISSGRFISFEGSEGSGKSTQITRLIGRLRHAGREIVSTREPGGTDLGERIRDILLHKDEGQGMCPESELLLFAAARAQLVRTVIIPALQRGAIVISDRYLDSSTVYQGAARNLAPGPVAAVNGFAIGDVLPHLTVVIDVPTEVSLARVRQRSAGQPDRIEREDAPFFKKVREAYLQLGRNWPQRVVIFDGTQSPDDIENKIWAEVQKRLG